MNRAFVILFVYFHFNYGVTDVNYYKKILNKHQHKKQLTRESDFSSESGSI